MEVIVILDFIVVIHEKGRKIEDVRIIIGINYREIFKILIGKIRMVNQYTKEGIAEVVKIKRLLDNTKIEVEFQLKQGYN